jgi:hypothetical protein
LKPINYEIDSVIMLLCDGSSGDVELEKHMANLMAEKFELFKKKQKSYGSNNIAALGERGIFIRIWDKVQRLKNLVYDEKPNLLNDESIEDTWGDLGIYSFMAILERQGKWPEFDEPLDIIPFEILLKEFQLVTELGKIAAKDNHKVWAWLGSPVGDHILTAIKRKFEQILNE